MDGVERSTSEHMKIFVGYGYNERDKWIEELVFPLNPSLADLKSALRDHGSPGVLMSGSGSSIFALAKSAAHARRMRRQIANTYPQSWVVRTIS